MQHHPSIGKGMEPIQTDSLWIWVPPKELQVWVVTRSLLIRISKQGWMSLSTILWAQIQANSHKPKKLVLHPTLLKPLIIKKLKKSQEHKNHYSHNGQKSSWMSSLHSTEFHVILKAYSGMFSQCKFLGSTEKSLFCSSLPAILQGHESSICFYVVN